MVRIAFLGVAGALLLAGCATSNTPYARPAPPPGQSPYTPTPGPSIFDTAPRATVHSEMFACTPNGSNIHDVGYRGELTLFTPFITTPAGPLLRMPTEAACLSSGFGWRGSLEGGRQHNGLDLANPEGGWVFAAADGEVVHAGLRGGYGYLVELDHGRGVRTLYAHLNEIDPRLQRGSRVQSGAAIARMGRTGNATGVHLHYEVWIDGLLVDPLNYGRPPTYVSAPAREPLPLPPQEAFAPPDAPDFQQTLAPSSAESVPLPPPVTLQTPPAQPAAPQPAFDPYSYRPSTQPAREPFDPYRVYRSRGGG